jgi:glutamate--cysteine ligase
MSFTREEPALAELVEDLDQLVDYFRAAEKPPEEHRVGTEHEKLGVYEADLSPVPYEGPNGIGALLAKLADRHDFSPMIEGEHLLGLARGETTITLEPGGQFELSGAPLYTMHETCREFHEHMAIVNAVSKELGIAWLGLGMHPLAPIDRIPRMPRERHALMRSFLGERGSLAPAMMHATAGVQANFDFRSEADAAAKLRVGLAASPVVTALYANSAISLGRPNGFESFRAQIWRATDPDRCGLLPFVFAEDFEELGVYRAYTEWALDVPMFFVVRGQHHRPVAGQTFRQLWQSGREELRPTLGDWHVHLTTLFPEVRLKRVIEVRGADAVAPGMVCALPALWKGLFYDPATLQAAQKRLMHWGHADVDALHADVARFGLQARTPDGPVLEIARELVELSGQGLARIQAQSGLPDERPLLDALHEVLQLGHSPAREVLNRWNGPLAQSVERLLQYARY